MNPKLIISLTTYPSRWDYLQIAIKSLLSQTIYDKVDLFYINIDDNLSSEDTEKYNSLLSIDPKIRIKICEARWRSANKLIWVYKDHPDDIIVCFDDDKKYPTKCLEQLYDEYTRHPNCIIAQEINPAIYCGQLKYLNAIDVKLLQKEYGKYLSNGCLFPPGVFTQLLYDYDKMMFVTNGQHDELWFWIVSTLNNVRCIGLNNTYSYQMDGNITLDATDGDLTNINCVPDIIDGYNQRLNEMFGKELNDIIENNNVEFTIGKDNILAFTGNIHNIHNLYCGFNILLRYDDTMTNSWHLMLVRCVSQLKWRSIKVKINDKCSYNNI